MKFQFQVRTGDFEYIMQEGEFLGPEDAAAAFRVLKAASQPQAGLAEKDFNREYDKLLNNGVMDGDPGILSLMSPQQQKSINDLKKAKKRFAYKEANQN